MTRLITPSLCLVALLALGGCGGSKPDGGGNVSMRDMEVVDGTANDSMADLDNATIDGTLLSNAGGLPGAVPMAGGTPASNAAAADNSSTPASTDKNTNAAAPQ